MAHSNDPQYYRKRELAERNMAANTNHRKASRIHTELADLYKQMTEDTKNSAEASS